MMHNTITSRYGKQWVAIIIMFGLVFSYVSTPLALVAQAEGEEAPPPAPPVEEPAPPPVDSDTMPPPADDPAPAPQEQEQVLEQTQEEPPTTNEGSVPPEPPSELEAASGGEATTDASDGTEGEEGSANDATPEGGDALVDTGDAAAIADSGNEVNTNSTNTPTNASTTVALANAATTTNEIESAAATGSNVAESSGGDAVVMTGDALAVANVINVVNTNIVNSSGILAFLNLLFSGGFDLRNFDLSYFFSGNSAAASTCSFSACDRQGSLTVGVDNDAMLQNDVIVRASTGGNTASTTGEGGAFVLTGNAYAAANAVNLVNSTFLNSHYLLVALNNFGSLSGDITLPNADFFSQLFSGGSSGLAPNTAVSANNTAAVVSTTTATAQTGGNTASGGQEGGAMVSTGSAVSGAASINQVNANFIGGTTVFFLINIIGNWSGTVQGLPNGLTWAQTPTGIVITNDEGGSGSGSGLSALTLNSNNSASVANNVQAWALTGDNMAEGGQGGALVHTGNAYASANTVNVVNTNVVGQNWLLAIFNIFGDWSGNLAFGHPDLWIGGIAQAPSPAAPGQTVTYSFTVANRGDADAHNVMLNADFPKRLLVFSGGNDSDTNKRWNLGTIARGEMRKVTYTATTGETQKGATVPVPLTATVSSDETDDDLSNNTEMLSIVLQNGPIIISGGSRGVYTVDPKIEMIKTVSTATTTTPSKVNYKVVIRNSGGEAYSTTLTDTLTDPEGTEVYSRSWKLDTIYPDDEIVLTYTVAYNRGIPPGRYTNVAHLTGQRGNVVPTYAVDMRSVTATSSITVLKGEVLGAQTSVTEEPVAPLPQACAPFITSYIKPGGTNDPSQVKRLQFFLRDFEGAAVWPTGVYDEATVAAVEAFQEKYATRVLSPWGTDEPSGFVYYTTQNEINNHYCQGIETFSLSATQKAQMATYRSGSTFTRGERDSLPPFSDLFRPFELSPAAAPLLSPSPATTPPLSTSWEPNHSILSLLMSFFELALTFGVPHVQAAGR